MGGRTPLGVPGSQGATDDKRDRPRALLHRGALAIDYVATLLLDARMRLVVVGQTICHDAVRKLVLNLGEVCDLLAQQSDKPCGLIAGNGRKIEGEHP